MWDIDVFIAKWHTLGGLRVGHGTSGLADCRRADLRPELADELRTKDWEIAPLPFTRVDVQVYSTSIVYRHLP